MPGTAFNQNNWAGYIPVTITNVGSLVSGFTLSIAAEDLPSSFAGNVQPDGADIRITASDGTTELPRDITQWQWNSASPTGVINIKCDLPAGDTILYIWIGYNGTAIDYDADESYGRYNAYDANIEAYWDLSDVTDRTANAHNLYYQGCTPGDSEGVLGRSTDFGAISTSYMYCLQIHRPGTMIAVIKPTATSGFGCIVGARNVDGNEYHFRLKTGILSTYLNGGSNDSSFLYPLNEWNHVAISMTTTLDYYKNASKQSVALPAYNYFNATYTMIGRLILGTSYKYYGYIQRVMLFVNPVSDDYVALDYKQVFDRANMFTIGSFVQNAQPDYAAIAANAININNVGKPVITVRGVIEI